MFIVMQSPMPNEIVNEYGSKAWARGHQKGNYKKEEEHEEKNHSKISGQIVPKGDILLDRKYNTI